MEYDDHSYHDDGCGRHEKTCWCRPAEDARVEYEPDELCQCPDSPASPDA